MKYFVFVFFLVNLVCIFFICINALVNLYTNNYNNIHVPVNYHTFDSSLVSVS